MRAEIHLWCLYLSFVLMAEAGLLLASLRFSGC